MKASSCFEELVHGEKEVSGTCRKVVVVFIVGFGVPQQSFVHLSCVPVEYVAHNKFSTFIKM